MNTWGPQYTSPQAFLSTHDVSQFSHQFLMLVQRHGLEGLVEAFLINGIVEPTLLSCWHVSDFSKSTKTRFKIRNCSRRSARVRPFWSHWLLKVCTTNSLLSSVRRYIPLILKSCPEFKLILMDKGSAVVGRG